MKTRIAVIMDPLNQVVPDKDTTVLLIREAVERGHEVLVGEVSDLSAHGPIVKAGLQRVKISRSGVPEPAAPKCAEDLSKFDAVFMRKDPPVDDDYLYATYLLSLVEKAGVFVINRPRGLREANEKLYSLNFPQFIPESLVSRDAVLLKQFLGSVGGQMIVKPVHGWGGLGVFSATKGDRNLNAILETVTEQGTRMVVAQRYIPEVRRGDKRVVVLDGKPIGAVLRVPSEEEHRSNIHVGGRCAKTSLTPREEEICAAVGPQLQADGLHLVGLDFIGGYLTEVNVTSPTGVQEINRLDGVNLEAKIIDFVETTVAARRAQGSS